MTTETTITDRMSTSAERGGLDGLSDALLEAARQVLEREGPGALTVRAIADEAKTSTMAVYSRFGGKGSILGALYRHGFEMLRLDLKRAPFSESGRDGLVGLGLAYRRFALANPALYGFMFERPLPGFDPPLDLRQEGLRDTFGVLVEFVVPFIAEFMEPDTDPVVVSYLIWSAVHGELSLELTQAARTRLPGWIIGGPEEGERIYLLMVNAVLSGLASNAG